MSATLASVVLCAIFVAMTKGLIVEHSTTKVFISYKTEGITTVNGLNVYLKNSVQSKAVDHC